MTCSLQSGSGYCSPRRGWEIQNVYALLINLSKLSFPSSVESRTLALTAAMADAMFHVLDCKVLLRRANGCRKCCSTSKNCSVLLFLNVKKQPSCFSRLGTRFYIDGLQSKTNGCIMLHHYRATLPSNDSQRVATSCTSLCAIPSTACSVCRKMFSRRGLWENSEYKVLTAFNTCFISGMALLTPGSVNRKRVNGSVCDQSEPSSWAGTVWFNMADVYMRK